VTSASASLVPVSDFCPPAVPTATDMQAHIDGLSTADGKDQGHPTCQSASRIAVGRAQRRVIVPISAIASRVTIRYLLLGADAAILLGLNAVVQGSPLQYSHRCAAIIIATLLLLPLTMLYIAGAYRFEYLLRQLGTKMLGGVAGVGALLGWLALRAITAKAGWTMVWIPSMWEILAVSAGFAAWVGISRFALRMWFAALESKQKILVIGEPTTSMRLVADIRLQRRTNPLIVVPLDTPDSQMGTIPSDPDLEVARPTALFALLKGHVKTIVLAHPFVDCPSRIQLDLVHARVMNIPIQTPCQFIEGLWERTPVTYQDPSWFPNDDSLHGGRSIVYQGVKRLLDILISLTVLVGVLPLMLLIAAVIKKSSPGPIFFTQRRIGLWKKEFTIIKFRTMVVDAEANGAQWAKPDDVRITGIGALLRCSRLDELPNLLNVLMGSMSLVGPRPERPQFNERLMAVIPYYDLRHLVKPGVSGWAQVCYPYGASVKDAISKLEYDIYYIKRASIWFDLRVLMRTVSVVLGMRGR
jgi:exopolysaccharide biosynthesis polyprenyl glycosylphosphotransferase